MESGGQNDLKQSDLIRFAPKSIFSNYTGTEMLTRVLLGRSLNSTGRGRTFKSTRPSQLLKHSLSLVEQLPFLHLCGR